MIGVEITDDIVNTTRPYCLLSIIHPDPSIMNNCDVIGIKCRGFFENNDEAKKAYNKLKQFESNFDIYCGNIFGRVISLYPSEDNIESIEYPDNDKLNELMNNDKVKRLESTSKKSSTYKLYSDNSTSQEFLFKDTDNLLVDPPIKNQKYFIFTVYTPEFIKNCPDYYIKLRGFSDTFDQASSLSSKLQSFDNNHFNIFIGEIGKWTPLNFKKKLNMDQSDMNLLNEFVGRLSLKYEHDKQQFNKRIDLAKQNKLHEVIDSDIVSTKDAIDNVLKSIPQPVPALSDEVSIDDTMKQLNALIDNSKKHKHKLKVIPEVKDGKTRREKLKKILSEKQSNEKNKSNLIEHPLIPTNTETEPNSVEPAPIDNTLQDDSLTNKLERFKQLYKSSN